MKISHWFIVAGFIAPLFACSASEDSGSGGSGGEAGSATGGTAGSVIPPTGGTGAENTGGTGNTGNTGGTGTGGSTATIDECKASGYNDAMCGACAEANCAQECEACFNDPNCMGYLSCTIQNQCQDAACDQACLDQYPGGDAPANAWLTDCLGTKCAQQCGGGTSCGLTVNDPACDTCFDTKCNAECVAFVGEPTWSEWLSCYRDCTDDACYTTCDETFPNAASTGEAFFGCMEDQCPTECGGGGTATDCGLTVNDPTCDTCFDTKCNAECKAFAAAPGWSDWLKCYQGCSDDACYEGCDTQFPEASSTGEAFFGCMEDQCATECGGGATTDCGLTVNDPTCDTCFDTKCNAECKAFAGSTGWSEWLTCYQGCTDEACYEGCDTQFPQAATTGEAFFGCMETNCATECAANP